jgi:hypothetical protein
MTTIGTLKQTNEWLEGLNNLVQYLENVQATNIELMPKPYSPINIYISVDTMEELQQYIKLFGSCEKYSDSTSIGVRKFFGTHKIDVYISHEVACERVVVGTRHVEAKLVEAYDEEIVEWRCPESFLGSI